MGDLDVLDSGHAELNTTRHHRSALFQGVSSESGKCAALVPSLGVTDADDERLSDPRVSLTQLQVCFACTFQDGAQSTLLLQKNALDIDIW